MNIRSEVSSFASHPIEAMIWVSEIESAKSVADLKTSDSITGSKLQTNFKVSRRSSPETSKEESSLHS